MRDSRKARFALTWEASNLIFGNKLKRPALQVPLPSRELLYAADSRVPEEVSVLRPT